VGIVNGDGGIVGVVNNGGVHVADVGVISKVPAIPPAAEEADAAVPEAVINAAVEADLRSPVSAMPKESAAAPAPIPWSP
jgi:hypothetical protein